MLEVPSRTPFLFSLDDGRLQPVRVGRLIEQQPVGCGHVSGAIVLGFQHGLHRRRLQAMLARSRRVQHNQTGVIAGRANLAAKVDCHQRIRCQRQRAMDAERVIGGLGRESINRRESAAESDGMTSGPMRRFPSIRT